MNIIQQYRRLLAGLLSLVTAATFALSATAQPYWDPLSPGAPPPDCGPVSLLQAKDGTLFGVCYSSIWPYLNARMMRWTKCGGWENIGNFGLPDEMTQPPSGGGDNYVSSEVGATCLSGNYLYVGGFFTSVQAPGSTTAVAATNVARFDLTSGTWSAFDDGSLWSIDIFVTNGVSTTVVALTVDTNQNVYVGLSGNEGLPQRWMSQTTLLRMWNGSNWSVVGGGMNPPSFQQKRYMIGVTALAAQGTNIFVGGDFDGAWNGANYVYSPGVIKWTGSSWVQMVHQAWGDNQNNTFSSIAVSGADVFVTGLFTGPFNSETLTYDPPYNLLRFSTSGTYIPGESLLKYGGLPWPGPEGIRQRLTAQDGTVYLGGNFDTVLYGNGQALTAYGLAKWANGEWSAVGLGTDLTSQGAPATVDDLAADDTAVYVTGVYLDGVRGEPAVNGVPVRWMTGVDPVCPGLINVDFSMGTGPSAKTGPAVVGDSPNDFWNFYTRDDEQGDWQTFGALPNLQYVNGVASTVGLTIENAPGGWYDGSADPMYNIYLYPFDDGNITVTVTNLAAGQYDFFVYGPNAKFQLAVEGTDYGTKTAYDSTGSNPPIWQEGEQYVSFGGVSVGTGQSVTILAHPGDNGYLGLSGLQIQKSVPVSLIDVDFSMGSGPSGKTGMAAVGQTTDDFWNFYTRDDGQGDWRTFGRLSNLKLSDGTTTSVGLTVENAPGGWYDESLDPMYNIYLYPFDGGNITLTVVNLPAGQYNFFPYGPNANFQLTVGGADYGTLTALDQSGSNPPAWQEGQQYVSFGNVSVGAGQPVVITVSPGDNGYIALSGLQIQAVPPQ